MHQLPGKQKMFLEQGYIDQTNQTLSVTMLSRGFNKGLRSTLYEFTSVFADLSVI